MKVRNKMTDQKEIQTKYMELQILGQQIKQIEQQLVNLNQQVTELKTLEDSLGEVKNVKEKTDFYAPLGGGIFLKSKLEDNKKVLMNVGSKIAVSKTIPEAKEIIKKQIEQIEDITKQMEEQMQQATMQSQVLQEELAKLSTGKKK